MELVCQRAACNRCGVGTLRQRSLLQAADGGRWRQPPSAQVVEVAHAAADQEHPPAATSGGGQPLLFPSPPVLAFGPVLPLRRLMLPLHPLRGCAIATGKVLKNHHSRSLGSSPVSALS